MNDLLSTAAYHLVRSMYADQFTQTEVDLIYYLYHYGAGFPEGPLAPGSGSSGLRGERRWQDPEQFLEILDSASLGDGHKASIVGSVHAALTKSSHISGNLPGWEQLAKVARRVVAASCCMFLNGLDPEKVRTKERWRPYLAWLELLDHNDTILTFNYDRVVELLKPEVGSSIKSAHVAGLRDDRSDRDERDLAQAQRRPILLKLHGSVDWVDEGDRVTQVEWEPDTLKRDLAIATPGDSKMKMAGSTFRRLWKFAEQSLEESNEVYILGFRFPPSDAFPRERLLSALGENKTPRRVDVVLGCERGPALQRVLTLLQWTRWSVPAHDPPMNKLSGVNAWSLYAEDFLNVWSNHTVRQQQG
jgi:hypothetical protein